MTKTDIESLRRLLLEADHESDWESVDEIVKRREYAREEITSLLPDLLKELETLRAAIEEVKKMETSFVDDDDWRIQRDTILKKYNL